MNREFVSFEAPGRPRNPVGFRACQGLLLTPQGLKPTTGFLAAHYSIDFSEHYLGPFLVERGYTFLGFNTRFRGAPEHFRLADALIDIGVGVQFLRDSGVERLVLLGNSGGGSLMAAYQSQATRFSLEPRRFRKIPDAARTLPPADLYISLQAHLGRPEVLTDWLDPSVTHERDPLSVDPTLDMYNPGNGPPYPTGFIERYRAAQRARNDRITGWALAELERLDGTGRRDLLFTVPRVWADLRLLDGAIDPSDRPLGRCYIGDPRRANLSHHGIAAVNTLRSWLEMWSLAESDCRAAPHLAAIDVPALVIQSTADVGVFPSDARAIHDALGAADKQLDLVAGDHYLTGAGERAAVADRIGAWIEAR